MLIVNCQSLIAIFIDINMRKIFLTVGLFVSLFTFAQVDTLIEKTSKEIDIQFEKSNKKSRSSLIKQFEFNIDRDRTFAISSDGEYFYIARDYGRKFIKLDFNGNQVGDEFTITGINNGLTTLTYDGRYFWGAKRFKTIYKIDMQSDQPYVVKSVTSPINVAHCTFDPAQDNGNGGLWVGDINSDIVLIDLSGTELARIPAETHGLKDIQSTALDNVNSGAPFMWASSVPFYENSVLNQIKLPEGMQTGETYILYDEDLVNWHDQIGGMFVMSDIIPGTTSLIILIQSTKVLGFDVTGLAVTDFDIGVSAINMQYYIQNTANYSVSGRVRNYGKQTINSYKLSYQIDNGDIVNCDITKTIAPGDQQTFTHTTTVEPVVGNHTIKVWTSFPNGFEDEYSRNDSMIYNYIVYDPVPVPSRTVLLEGFTASTCDPCYSGNLNLKNVLEENTGNYALVKYQMNWPGTGDPYFTKEGGTRSNFYAVKGVPHLHADGYKWNNGTGLFNNSILTGLQNVPAVMSLNTEYYVEGKTIYAKTKINSTIDLFSNMRLFTAILERKTVNNVKSNGETEFNNVFKKFIPDDNGVKLNGLNEQTSFMIEHEWEFKGNYRLPVNALSPINHEIEHSIEDFGNLIVVTWVQDIDEKSVYQACNAVLTYATVTYGTVNSLGTISATHAGNPIEQGKLLEANIELTFKAVPYEGYKVKKWILNGTDVQNNVTNELSIILDRNSDVKVEFQSISGINDILLSDIKINPNPFNKNITVINSGNINVKSLAITNIWGQTVKEFAFSGTNLITLDTENLRAGIYFLILQAKTGEKVVHKMVKSEIVKE